MQTYLLLCQHGLSRFYRIVRTAGLACTAGELPTELARKARVNAWHIAAIENTPNQQVADSIGHEWTTTREPDAMLTRQPKWKCVAQLGDANPLDHGGFWVFIDETGVYEPEAEILLTPDNDDNAEPYEAYRFILEPCTYQDGILSDNAYHPDHPAWFAKPEAERAERPQDTTYLKDLANCIGQTVDELVAGFTSDDPIKRADAWRTVGEYHGWNELDDYPLTMTRTEARRRYRLARYRVKE